jgi:hypothetical protein
MRLRAVARDCLFLNWAVPRAALQPPPEPLVYDVEADGTVLVSALLYRHEGLRLRPRSLASLLPLSYPQLQLRLCVRDGEGTPSVLVCSILVPRWVLPGARWWIGASVRSARFELPETGSGDEEGLGWSVESDLGALRLEASAVDTPAERWRSVFESIRRRSRGYIAGNGGLLLLETTYPAGEAWPLRVRLADVGLLPACLRLSEGSWPDLHSAWLAPELSLVLERGAELELALPRQVPAPG